jgi:environmental stress-induced protein Ves
MPSKKYRHVFLFLLLYLVHSGSLAVSPQGFDQLTLSIMSYSSWPNVQRPVLCVVNNPEMAMMFEKRVQQSSYPYQILAVSSANFSNNTCHAAYFSDLSVMQQSHLIQNYPSRRLLSFSQNNMACEIGAIFCLYEHLNRPSFKVNLDALAQAQVRVDPRVLLLARNAG